MKKIKKEIFFLVLSILSVLGTILSFIFLQQYIPEYFIYINNNCNNGFTKIVQSGGGQCKLPLLKDNSFKFYKKPQKDFFNKEYITDNLKNGDNIKEYRFTNINLPNYPHCLDNRSNYFDIKLEKYNNNTSFENCKFIDSLNNTSCENSYSSSLMIDEYTKYNEIVFGQDQPCFDPRYFNFNMTFNKTSYYYDKSKCPGGKTNKHYHFLKEVVIQALLDNNNLIDLQNSLDDNIKQQNLNVYGRNYIGIKDECRHKPFKELNNKIEEKNNYIKNSNTWIAYISLIEIVFFLLFLNRFTVKYHNYANNIKKDEDNSQMKEILPPYTKPVILILSLIQLGFHILVFTYLLNIRDFIDLFQDTSCFEEEAGELIKPSILFLNLARYTQIGVLAINAILAYKYGIKKGIKYAN